MSDARTYDERVTLKNGQEIRIRALHPDDDERLVEAFHKLAPESIYLRFFGPKKELTAGELQRFRELDFDTRVTLVATMPEGEREIIIGSASYARVDTTTAEVAFVVEEDFQGLGIAGRLLAALGGLALAAGITHFHAETLPQNAVMQRVFARCGWPVTSKSEDGCVFITITLDGKADA